MQLQRTSQAVERACLVFELDAPGGVSAFQSLCAEAERVVRLVNFLTGQRKKLKPAQGQAQAKKKAGPLRLGQSC